MAKTAKKTALLPFAIVPTTTASGKPCYRIESSNRLSPENFAKFRNLVSSSGGFSFPKYVEGMGRVTHVMKVDESTLLHIASSLPWEPKTQKAKKATKKAAKVAALADLKAEGAPIDLVESITAKVLKGLKLAGAL